MKKIIVLAFALMFLGAANHIVKANVTDSLRVLCTMYDKGSGLDGTITLSAFMECDSLSQPLYVLGDSVVTFFSDVRVDAIKDVYLVTDKKFTKRYGKNLPNGLLMMELKENETFGTSQIVPLDDNISRKAFVTKFTLSDFDNATGQLTELVTGLCNSYATDDEPFRAFKSKSEKSVSPILAIDTLNHKAFVQSFNDFKEGAVANITAYPAEEAMKIVGSRGVNGLIIVLIDSKFTLNQAVRPQSEKILEMTRKLEEINLTTMYYRKPIIIK